MLDWLRKWWWIVVGAVLGIFALVTSRRSKGPPTTEPTKLDEKRIKLIGELHRIEREEKALNVETEEIRARIDSRSEEIARMDAEELAAEYNRLAARRKALDGR
jgi:seryl-tRNA synthetase